MKNVLLINAEGVQTICLARSLRQQGHYVVGFCNHKMTSGYTTRWLSERHKSPDITMHKAEFGMMLFDYLKENHIDLIIPLADDGAEYLSQNKKQIESMGMRTAIPSYDIFNLANDKEKLMKLCEQYGLCHPKTRGIPVDLNVFQADSSGLTELITVSNYVGFPAVIKPNISQGAKGIVKVDNINELINKYPAVYEQFGACTLQQYVNQPGYYYNVMMYRDKNGNIAGQTIIKIRRFFPIYGGSSCYSETVEHPFLLKQCEKVLMKLEWVGFADFDVLEDNNTGDLKIIEINPRMPSSLQASFAAGIDFGKILIADEFNEPMPTFEYKTGKQVRWMGLDVMWFIFSPHRFSFKPSWFKFFGKDVSYHDGAWNDPLPMLAGVFAGLAKYMNSRYRKAKLRW